jgi:hypothetical protein
MVRKELERENCRDRQGEYTGGIFILNFNNPTKKWPPCGYGSFPSISYYFKYLEKLEVKLLVFINVPFLLFTRKGTGRTCRCQIFLLQFAMDSKTANCPYVDDLHLKLFYLVGWFFCNESKCAKLDTVPAHILFSHIQYNSKSCFENFLFFSSVFSRLWYP